MAGLEIRFANAPGIVDSDWMRLAPGISVLTGRNNVGKSRILQAVTTVMAAHGNAAAAPAAPQIRLEDEGFLIAADFHGSPPPAMYELRGHSREELTSWSRDASGTWQLVLTRQGQPQVQWTGQGLAGAGQLGGVFPEIGRVATFMSRVIYVPPQRLIPARVPTAPVDVPTATGQDLGQAIYKHRNAMTPQFAEFENTLSSMLPEISAVLSDPVDVSTVLIRLRDRFARKDIPADEAGTGVSALMHLIATVLFMPAERILLIDEPQLHLHPGAEKLLARFFRTHSEHDYVFATHSPVFVSALEPDRAWLLTRDERGTLITSVFEAGLPRSHVLQELGLSPGDIVLAERFLLVEGPGDVAVYPNLMRRLGWDAVRLNCSVLQLQGGDTARPLREVVEELATLLNLPLMILLDGDKRGEIPESDVVRLLPVPDVETVFLRDPEAIRSAFDVVINQEQLEGFDLDGWRREWTAERIEEFIRRRLHDAPQRKGAEVLGDLAHAMGNLTYRKTVHGPRIAKLIRPDALGDVADVLEPLLGARLAG